MPTKRLAASLGALLGFLGVIGCAAAMLAAVWVGLRLSKANDRTFALADRSLLAARGFLLAAQRRAQEITADDLTAAVRDWGSQEIRQDLVARFDGRARSAAERLRQAEGWLQTSSTSIQAVAQTLDLVAAVGGAADGTVLASASDLIANLMARLRDAIEAIEQIRQRTAALLEDRPRQEQAASLIQLTAGAAALVDRIDARLGEAAQRLDERRSGLDQLRVTTRRRILIAVLVILMILAWMAAGQAALCAYGWRSWRASRPPPPPVPAQQTGTGSSG